jgi:hypothetical protein
MTNDQKGVATFAPIALATTLIALAVTYYNSTFFYAVGFHLSAATATLLASFWLIVSVGTIGNKRFFHQEHIGGSAFDAPGSPLRIDKAILQNTLEQLVIAAAVYHALEAAFDTASGVYLATLVTLFTIGRFSFLMGYQGGAGSRAFGFGMTFYPTILTFAFLVLGFIFRWY